MIEVFGNLLNLISKSMNYQQSTEIYIRGIIFSISIIVISSIVGAFTENIAVIDALIVFIMVSMISILIFTFFYNRYQKNKRKEKLEYMKSFKKLPSQVREEEEKAKMKVSKHIDNVNEAFNKAMQDKEFNG
jgi:uncharacterized protein YacL